MRDQADEDTSPDHETEADDYVDWSEHGLGLYLDPTSIERLSGEATDAADCPAEYRTRDETWPTIVAAVRRLGVGAARRSGLYRRTIQRAVRQSRGPTTPHRANQARIAATAAAEAEDRLVALGETSPGGTLPTLLATSASRKCAS